MGELKKLQKLLYMEPEEIITYVKSEFDRDIEERDALPFMLGVARSMIDDIVSKEGSHE